MKTLLIALVVFWPSDFPSVRDEALICGWTVDAVYEQTNEPVNPMLVCG